MYALHKLTLDSQPTCNYKALGLQPNYYPFTPGYYILDMEPTFMKAQIWPIYLSMHISAKFFKCITIYLQLAISLLQLIESNAIILILELIIT